VKRFVVRLFLTRSATRSPCAFCHLVALLAMLATGERWGSRNFGMAGTLRCHCGEPLMSALESSLATGLRCSRSIFGVTVFKEDRLLGPHEAWATAAWGPNNCPGPNPLSAETWKSSASAESGSLRHGGPKLEGSRKVVDRSRNGH